MENLIDALNEYAPLFPEIVLTLGALALLLGGVLSENEGAGRDAGRRGGVARRRGSSAWVAIAIIVAAAALLYLQEPSAQQLFGGSFVADTFARYMKLLALFAVAVTLIMARDTLTRHNLLTYEFSVLVLFATLGMMVMISAGDLIALYLGLEMQSLALYVVAALRRDSLRSTEAGLKYFVLGALSSGMLLYGASLVYGFTGSVNFTDIAAVIQNAGPTAGQNVGLVFGLVFVFAGLAFKVSAVPFHMWTPDVYEGAPTPVTAFFAAAPKVAAMALFIRVAIDAFLGIAEQWQQIVMFISFASMAWGAFAALGQRNIKRLMAYSSIGHMGYALVGLSAGSPEGIQGVLVYLVIYVVMTVGVFACILAMRRAEKDVENIEHLAGLSRNDPFMAFVLAMLLFSLAGMPPLAGFFGKFYVFAAAVKAGLWPLAILGVLASVVALVYYLRIIKIMYVDEPAETFDAAPASLRWVMGLSVAFVLLLVLSPSTLISVAQVAAISLFPT